jgi:hypothetical protein
MEWKLFVIPRTGVAVVWSSLYVVDSTGNFTFVTN